MGIKLFSSKGRPNKLRKKQPLQSPDPPPIYPAEQNHGSQSTIRPTGGNASDERLSIASTLIVEPSAYTTRNAPPLPRYRGVAPNDGLLQRNNPRAPPAAPRRRSRRLSQEPLFPNEPSNLVVSRLSHPGDLLISTVPIEIWDRIAGFATPADAANLALASKTLRYRLGSGPWEALSRPENKKDKVHVLLQWDGDLKDQLLCFLCGTYHDRIRPGHERLQPPNSLVTSPIYDCPNATEMVAPRARLTHGRTLPFALVQLAMRGERYTPEHGISWTALSRRWKCKDSNWSHATRVYFYKDHLLFRNTSTCFAGPNLTPSQERLLLYSRSDYAPYFSVCEHWHKGDLMRYCKCALSHIPAPGKSIITQLKKAPGVSLSKIHPNQFPKQCDECKPIRRCPYCPTEYLIEIKLVEDKMDPIHRFKHAICVTRWSDFGDCKSPDTLEWASCNGEAKMHSFGAIKHATLSTIFETAVSNAAPTSKLMPLRRGGHVY